MKIMCVADCHSKLTERSLLNYIAQCDENTPEICLFLGDNSIDDIECVRDYLEYKQIDIPCYGVLGNHDGFGLDDAGLNIENLHLKTVNVGGLVLGGFEGSYRYTEKSGYPLYSHEESIELLNAFEPCDIFVTHSNPQFRAYEQFDATPPPITFWQMIESKLFPKSPIIAERPVDFETTAHSGLVGVGDYIERICPRLNLHGHIHTPQISRHGSTIIRCCYGVEIIDTELIQGFE